MTQASPSYVLYHQAALIVKDLLKSYQLGAFPSIDDLTVAIREALSRYEEMAGRPQLGYEEVSETEPPTTAKMNKTWRTIQNDINVAKRQAEVLRAATVLYHNTNVTELTKSRNENSRARNKIKTLQLYNEGIDPSVVTYSQFFHDDEFIDYSKNQGVARASILDNSFLCLGFDTTLTDVTKSAKVKVLETSNGFMGNNVEIKDPNTAITNPNTETPYYIFYGETLRGAEPKSIADSQPNTWFEYEHAVVSEEDQTAAGNLNFTYEGFQADGTSYEVNWADGPSDGVLKLDLEIDLNTSKKINYVSLLPYGLVDNRNLPIHVVSVQTSVDGTEWIPVLPGDVWIGTDANLAASRTAANIAVGSGVWSFAERSARFIRFSIEQPNAIEANIGHLYYLKSGTEQRVEGPVPPLNNPTKYYDPSKLRTRDVIQGREFFAGKRHVIGIRDITVYQIRYVPKSVAVTDKIRLGGTADRVMLEADMYIPSEFDNSTSWIKFFISPDDGDSWHQISRVTDDFLGIPEILAFNDPTPEAFRETGVRYINTTNEVKDLRVKFEVSRPVDQPYSSPMLRSFKLKVRTNV